MDYSGVPAPAPVHQTRPDSFPKGGSLEGKGKELRGGSRLKAALVFTALSIKASVVLHCSLELGPCVMVHTVCRVIAISVQLFHHPPQPQCRISKGGSWGLTAQVLYHLKKIPKGESQGDPEHIPLKQKVNQ